MPVLMVLSLDSTGFETEVGRCPIESTDLEFFQGGHIIGSHYSTLPLAAQTHKYGRRTLWQ